MTAPMPARSRRRLLVEAALVFVLTLGVARAMYAFAPLVDYIPVLLAYVPLTIMLLRKERPEDYGLTLRGAGGAIRDVLILCVLFFPPFVLLFHAFQSVVFHARLAPAVPRDLLRWSVFQLLLVALPEELFYRGYVQTVLNRVFARPFRAAGARWGAGLPAADALFALSHVVFEVNPLRLNVFLPGLLFGWLRERGGLLGPILFHAVCNVLVRVLEASYIHP